MVIRPHRDLFRQGSVKAAELTSPSFLRSRLPAVRPTAFRCALLAACACLLAPAIATAQDSAPSPQLAAPAYEVATIKPSDPERTEGNIGFDAGGSFQARGISLRELIQLAYDLGYFAVDQRIVGGPRWIGTTKFDLNAKCDDQAASSFAKVPIKKQLPAEQAMIRRLLADRFNLRLHHETRQLPVLILVAAHGGPKLTASPAPNPMTRSAPMALRETGKPKAFRWMNWPPTFQHYPTLIWMAAL